METTYAGITVMHFSSKFRFLLFFLIFNFLISFFFFNMFFTNNENIYHFLVIIAKYGD